MNRTRSLVSFVAAAIFLTTPSLIAQFGQQPSFQANVPFQFSVANKTLPAGVYHISREGFFLHVNSDSTGAYAVAIKSDASKDGNALLIFDRVDGQYFLRRLVTPSSGTSLDLSTSSSEKKAIRALTPMRVASNVSPDTVTINLPNGAQ